MVFWRLWGLGRRSVLFCFPISHCLFPLSFLSVVMRGWFQLAGWSGRRIDHVFHCVWGRGMEAGAGAFKGGDFLGDDVDHVLCLLQLSLDRQERLAAHQGAFLQV